MRSEFGQRLYEARTSSELTQAQLASSVGISQGTLGELEKKGQGSAHAAGLARACGVSVDWLVYGTGEMRPQHEPDDEGLPMFSRSSKPDATQNYGAVAQSPDPAGIPASKFKPVWVVGRGAGGLMPELLWTDGDFPVGSTDEYAEVASQDPHAFLTQIVGTSMVPRYNPGEFALVEPGTDPDLEDDVLVRLADGQTLLKRLLSRRGGYRLGSYNDSEVHFYEFEQVTWVYYVAHPVPRRKIKQRAGTGRFDLNW